MIVGAALTCSSGTLEMGDGFAVACGDEHADGVSDRMCVCFMLMSNFLCAAAAEFEVMSA